MDGGEAAYDVLNDDQDINQEEALARARAIVKDFPQALKRIGLEKEWKAVAGGRRYDLEAAEHNLCGWCSCGVLYYLRVVRVGIACHVHVASMAPRVTPSTRCPTQVPG